MTEMSHSIAGLPAASVPGGVLSTMSTLEIAELTGKRHDHVMVDVRNMLFQLGKGDPEFRGSYRTAQNKEAPCYHLPQRECLILVSGYSIPMRAKIVDRWQDLERAVATSPAVTLPQTFAEALRLAADKAEENERLSGQVRQQAEQIAFQAPKVEAYERIAEADGSMCITEAAKNLQLRPTDLFKHLRTRAWIYRRAGAREDLGYQARIAAGLLEHKVTVQHRGDGSERVCTQVRVTPKGLARLAHDFLRT